MNVPEETERAEVEVWLVCLGMDTAAWSPERPEDGVYTLRLYRADGSLLEEQSGTLPEE